MVSPYVFLLVPKCLPPAGLNKKNTVREPSGSRKARQKYIVIPDRNPNLGSYLTSGGLVGKDGTFIKLKHDSRV